ncbi:hypothetical protein ACX2DF_13720 [Pseudomonas aeruginosa]
MNNIAEMTLSARFKSILFRGNDVEVSAFGFECLDGWEGLLSGALHLAQTYAIDKRLDLQITSIKEKFGALRICHHGGDEAIDLVFDITELVSSCTCEICGKQGTLIDLSGWLQTRCTEHAVPNPSTQNIKKHSLPNYSINYARTLGTVVWFFKKDSLRWASEKNIGLGGIYPYEALASLDGCEEVYLLIQRLSYGVEI